MSLLRSGGVLAVAPEGKISKTGGLLQGHPGVAHLATRFGAPIVPLVIYGQERTFGYWARLGRPLVRVRIGTAIQLPRGRGDGQTT